MSLAGAYNPGRRVDDGDKLRVLNWLLPARSLCCEEERSLTLRTGARCRFPCGTQTAQYWARAIHFEGDLSDCNGMVKLAMADIQMDVDPRHGKFWVRVKLKG